VYEHRVLEVDIGRSDQVLNESQSVDDELRAGLEIAHEKLVTLLGDLRRGGDVDHERHLALLANLRHRERRPRFERADHALRAFGDRPLRLRAR
jgi:hypothetical protein